MKDLNNLTELIHLPNHPYDRDTFELRTKLPKLPIAILDGVSVIK